MWGFAQTVTYCAGVNLHVIVNNKAVVIAKTYVKSICLVSQTIGKCQHMTLTSLSPLKTSLNFFKNLNFDCT